MASGATPQGVLDYASPRTRGKLRLPAQSRLHVSDDEDGVTVLETLSGKREAIVALAVAPAALVVMAAVVIDGYDLFSGRSQIRVGPDAVVAAFLWVAGITVTLMVIHNTWRRTVLRVSASGVSLEFSSPFVRRTYGWEAERVENVRVERTGEAVHTLLAELQIHPMGAPVVHLFTDHAETELTGLCGKVRARLGLAPPGMPARHSTNIASP